MQPPLEQTAPPGIEHNYSIQCSLQRGNIPCSMQSSTRSIHHANRGVKSYEQTAPRPSPGGASSVVSDVCWSSHGNPRQHSPCVHVTCATPTGHLKCSAGTLCTTCTMQHGLQLAMCDMHLGTADRPRHKRGHRHQGDKRHPDHLVGSHTIGWLGSLHLPWTIKAWLGRHRRQG